MADQEQFERLRQGVAGWNVWRSQNHNVEVDLSGAKLKELDLTKVNLRGADLRLASLMMANLRQGDLSNANLSHANLFRANLRNADLSEANLISANLCEADLSWANLNEANLFTASLIQSILRSTQFKSTSMTGTLFGGTVISDLDLSRTDLNQCTHTEPSSVDQATLANFQKMPMQFLRGCGLQDWQIESAKLLRKDLSPLEITEIWYKVHDLRTTAPIVLTNLFVSYSHRDGEFVDYLGRTLEKKRILFWRGHPRRHCGTFGKHCHQGYARQSHSSSDSFRKLR